MFCFSQREMGCRIPSFFSLYGVSLPSDFFLLCIYPGVDVGTQDALLSKARQLRVLKAGDFCSGVDKRGKPPEQYKLDSAQPYNEGHSSNT